METPDNHAGRLTDQIMWQIRDHIKRDPPPQESHHYNRTFEAVYRILRADHADVKTGDGEWRG